MNIFLSHHLGMGDQIVHNGMIRKLIADNKGSTVFVPSLAVTYENVKYMFRDLQRLEIIKVKNYQKMHEFAANFQGKTMSTCIGKQSPTGKLTVAHNLPVAIPDDEFYHKINIDPKVKTEYFYIQRNHKREKKVYETLTKNNRKYIFLHENKHRNVVIDRQKIKSKFPIIQAGHIRFFDLLYTIEQAKECHVISSSFLSLFMCKKFNKNVVAHMYTNKSRLSLSYHIAKHNIKVLR